MNNSFMHRLGFYGLMALFVIFAFPALRSFAFSERSLPSGQYSRAIDDKSGPLPAGQKPRAFEGVTIVQRLGDKIPPTLTLTRHDGVQQTTEQVFGGAKPTLLTLNYFRCVTLCSVQLQNVAQTIKALGSWNKNQYRIVTVSFDPTDKPADALAKRKELTADLGNVDWDFYVADEKTIETLTDKVGFYYRYDPITKEFAHAAAVLFVSPSRTLVRYLYGIAYEPRQVKLGLLDAADGKIGSLADQILLYCYHYDPSRGSYTNVAVKSLRFAAFGCLVLLSGFLAYWFWRDRKKNRQQ